MNKNRAKVKFILGLIKKNFKCFLITFIAAGICALLSLVMPVLIQNFIDMLMKGEYDLTGKLLTYIVLYIISSIALYLFKVMKKFAAEDLGWQVSNNLRIDIMNKILSYDQSFFNEFSSGNIVEVFNKDIRVLYSFLSNSAILILINIFTIMGIIIVLSNKNILIGISFAVFISILFFVIYKVQSIKSGILLEERNYNSSVTSFYKECIDARKEINVLGKIVEVINKLDKVFDKWLPLKVKSQKYLYRVWITTLVSLGIANCLSLLIGGELYIKDVITIGTVYLLYSYSNLLKEPMEYMQVSIQSIMMVSASLERLEKVSSYKCRVKDGSKNWVKDEAHIKITSLEHSFNDKKVLKNINLEIKNKEKVGIFGVSGSGKSTLCKLICKLEDIQQGNIFINNEDLNNISVNSLRNKTALFTTSGQIFEGTLKDNITLFNEVDDDKVMSVLEEYNILDLFNIDKNEILNYKVSEDSLSSGQKQIINLCRLFFVEKDLLIFDEASSRVDKDIEEKFYYILDELMKSKTSIVVTHNVERLKNCDTIAVMDMGKIIEYGKTEVLGMDISSLYSQFVNKRLEVTK